MTVLYWRKPPQQQCGVPNASSRLIKLIAVTVVKHHKDRFHAHTATALQLNEHGNQATSQVE